MKKFAWFAIFALALGMWPAAGAADLKLGYVDMQRAVKEVEEGKRAFKKLRRTYNRYQKEIRKKEQDLKKFQEELKKQALLLTEDAKKQKGQELQRKVLEFQNLYLEKQRDLQQRESKLMSPIIGRLVKLVQQLGERGEYTMILEKNDSRILFAQQSLDLTNEVIRLYNSGKKKKKE